MEKLLLDALYLDSTSHDKSEPSLIGRGLTARGMVVGPEEGRIEGLLWIEEGVSKESPEEGVARVWLSGDVVETGLGSLE